MAGRPLRPATDRRLGGPLPHQLANPASAAPITRGLTIPRFPPQGVCGISTSFDVLSPITGYVPVHYSPVRHSPPGASTRAAVRLACVKHAASVQSEPGSNSSV